MTAQASGALPTASPAINAEDTTRAMLNILEDFLEEKARLEKTQKAALNILEDFAGEKARFEDTQRAMLNLIDDFGTEREKTEAINRELRQAEEQIKRSLDEKVVLLKEVHHRVKNNLQIISSLLNLQMPYIKDSQAIELFKESQNRVISMALIHEKLYQSESLARIDLAEYIQSLTDNLFRSYGAAGRAVKLKIDAVGIALDIDTVIPCALIINELVSNALKHAFPDSRRPFGGTGEIRIDLHRDADNRFVLIVTDNGVGLPEGFAVQNCESLGLKLVGVLVKQLRGVLHLGPGNGAGAGFTITFDAPK